MGQFFLLINVTKRQYVGGSASGKFIEAWSNEELLRSFAILMSVGNGLGGGDLRVKHPLVGSWAGDRIALLGEYAQFDSVRTDEVEVDDDWYDVGEQLRRIVATQLDYERNRREIDEFLKREFSADVGRIPVEDAKRVFLLRDSDIGRFTTEMERSRDGVLVVGADDAAAAAILVNGSSWHAFLKRRGNQPKDEHPNFERALELAQDVHEQTVEQIELVQNVLALAASDDNERRVQINKFISQLQSVRIGLEDSIEGRNLQALQTIIDVIPLEAQARNLRLPSATVFYAKEAREDLKRAQKLLSEPTSPAMQRRRVGCELCGKKARFRVKNGTQLYCSQTCLDTHWKEKMDIDDNQ